jgi:hypothetical protein
MKPTQACPFCKSQRIKINSYMSRKGPAFFYDCMNCHARGPLSRDEREAASKWDLREDAAEDRATPQ